MRLHHLSMTAFGPFADTAEVDFDALSGTGLFLLAGPTGAGKTTVLDAVCFALYGDVPGDRREAKRLRCDLAPPERPPRVVLEATVAGHRYRFSRSPAWERPKKRGTGTTREQASVVIERLDDGEVLTTRLDEAGDLVGNRLGMTLSQFTQVAMLPQGRFQDFLRAAPEQRQSLLQQLFATARFERVESWLAEHRRATRRELEAQGRRVTTFAHRFAEATESPVPENVVGDTLDAEAIERWVRLVTHELAGSVAEAERAAGVSSADAARAAGALDAARELTTRQQHHAAATATLERLGEERAEVDTLRRALDAAHRAAPVGPRQQDVREQQDAVASASAAYDEARQRLGEGPPDEASQDEQTDWLAGCCDAAYATWVRLGEHRSLEEDLHERSEEARLAAAEVTTAEQQETALARQQQRLPQQITATEQEIAAAERAERDAERLEQAVRDLEGRCRAARRRDEQRTEEEEHQRAATRAREAYRERQERLRQLREERLHQMAAELARSLAVGESCPVCGACEHPSPAATAAGAPTAEQERELQREVDDADVTRQAHDERVRAVQVRRARAEHEAGPDSAMALEAELATRHREHDAATATAEGLPQARQQLTELQQQREDLAGRVSEVRAQLAGARSRATAASGRCEELAGRLAAVLEGYPDLDSRLRAAEEHYTALQCARDAHRALREAREALSGRHRALAAEAHRCGFQTPEEAVAALLDDDTAAGFHDRITHHDDERRDAERTLGQQSVRAAVWSPAPDLDALRQAAEAASARDTECQGRRHRQLERQSRAEELAASARDSLQQWAPAQQRWSLAAGVAALAEGKAEDNEQRISLSAYVLAWRLAQVVAAANDRLAGMTDHRYSLVHSQEVAPGQRRGGLGLRVHDEWSDEERDPRTLSGGETFQVSLALALGLTDVVSAEAGGTRLGTLFIDEGFGSLDAEALEKVMDTLDELRDAGRVVGLVSHVTELRERVPARVEAVKTRRGSRLTLDGVC